VNGKNLTKIDVVEIKRFILFLREQAHEEKGELKMRRKFRKLLKTNIEKMPVSRLSIIFMKTNELNLSLHYVDEKKGGY